MLQSILLFTLLSFLPAQLFGQENRQTPPVRREIVQISANGSDRKFVNHPTFALFAGAPRELSLPNSPAGSPTNYDANGPWKIGITATVFWVGEPPTANDPGNLVSAWDRNWLASARYQNAFYVALPYNDVANGHTKPEAKSIIPWFSQAYVRDGQSVLKNHWVAIRKGAKVCYAQWEDVGPFQVDHWQYVFGNERPHPNKNKDAGIDVEAPEQRLDLPPGLRGKLGLSLEQTLDEERLTKLLGALLEMVATLDNLVWNLWKTTAPKSALQREAGDGLRRTIGRYLAGDREVATLQVNQMLDKTRQLFAGLLSAIGPTGETYARKHLETFAPEKIRATVKTGGFLTNVEQKCWRRYVVLASELSGPVIEKQIIDTIVNYTEEILSGRRRGGELSSPSRPAI